MELTSGHSSKPRRPPSHAKRHFEVIVESRLTKWKCKYCAMTYGEKTATSNLWRHLEKKHRQNIGANDQRQSMAIRKCNSGQMDAEKWTSIDECSSTKRLKLEQHHLHFTDNQPHIRMAMQSDDVIESVGYRYCPLSAWVPNHCSTHRPCNHRTSCEPDSSRPVQPLTTGQRIQEAIHRILSTRPDFVDFFNEPQVTQLMHSMAPDFQDAMLVNVVKALVASKEREIIGQLKKHDGGLHLNLEMINVSAGQFKMTMQVAYEELNDHYGQMSSADEDEDDALVRGSKVKARHCPLCILNVNPETTAEEHCARIIETLEKFCVKNRLLTVTIGQCRFMYTLVSALQSILGDIGIYTISKYATVDSIRDELSKNLQEFRHHAEDIRNTAEEILDFSKDLQKPMAPKANKRSRLDKKVTIVKIEVNQIKNRVDQVGHPNDLLLRTLQWDLMPILPRLHSLEDFLSEARALGVSYNFNSGSDWKRLSHVLQEVRLNLQRRLQPPTEEDHQKLLRMLLKKLSLFPDCCERAIRFLQTTGLSSPLTQHIVDAAKKLPKTMDNEHANNNLLLKMWTKFERGEI